MVREYVVVSRDLQWPVLTDGVRWRPYESGSVAEASAISLAKLYFKTGRPASVTVEGDLDKFVYSATAGDRVAAALGNLPILRSAFRSLFNPYGSLARSANNMAYSCPHCSAPRVESGAWFKAIGTFDCRQCQRWVTMTDPEKIALFSSYDRR